MKYLIKTANMTKNKFKSIRMLLAGILCVSLAQAQKSANTSGGNATGSGGNVSYSIGQVVYTTNLGSSGSVMQGVQQAYEIFSLSINESHPDISLTAFPNPTADLLTLQVGNYNNEKLCWQLYDLQGKILNQGQIQSQQTQINMKALPPAIYFIQIRKQGNTNIQSFKVIKK
jgi:hypothetical protein